MRTIRSLLFFKTTAFWDVSIYTRSLVDRFIYKIIYIFFYFLQIYNVLYKLSNKQICYKETLVRSNNPIIT
jgi:hypothetical protein